MKEVAGTFKEISEKIFDQSTSGKSSILFSRDNHVLQGTVYQITWTVDSGQWGKRIIKGENTRSPEKWKDFLSYDVNKQQLVRSIDS
jgi:hypothetical protein